MDRDGFVMGEGAGALVVEDLELALARGTKFIVKLLDLENLEMQTIYFSCNRWSIKSNESCF